jgi:hypothetical protein
MWAAMEFHGMESCLLCSDLVLVLCSSVDEITMNDEMPDS